ncbi:ubiquitin-ubiquitin ligase UFD2 ASCRUDRAFT_76309 [Ascoidea rubescens DSM 1968]|uniref:RING-type E3 ubiquitin transferase n=1 Tax=Ascoidea rubescens DSM 1968 TaxID=1344418 RepID=A0A1D2VFD6_9ASCO|nr:hypothetical protein ASCRUDRAFT_76309 [Ascoidea rubescens DSM 1968]ODV60292.1 hypothetical protein ASCRUDRAFT_76309 [Ascoidea rubescens DSM 1968]
MDNPDDIRAKRLARLAKYNKENNLSAPHSSSSSSSSPKHNSNPSRPATSHSTSTRSSTPSANPFSALLVSQNIKQQNLSNDTLKQKSIPNHPTKQILSKNPIISDAQLEDHYNNWVNDTLQEIFQATVNPNNTNLKLKFLKSTYNDLINEKTSTDSNSDDIDKNISVLFNKNVVDAIIDEMTIENAVPNPVLYLFNAWESAKSKLRSIKSLRQPLKLRSKALNNLFSSKFNEKYKSKKIALLDQIVNLSLNYTCSSFQIPDMFLNNTIEKTVFPFLSHNPNELINDFLFELIKTAKSEGSLFEFINSLVPYLSKYLLENKVTMDNKIYLRVFTIYRILLNDKAIAAEFSNIDDFCLSESQNPSDVEFKTILGPILSLSPLHNNFAKKILGNSAAMSKLEIDRLMESLQAEYKLILEFLFFVFDKLIRASNHSRESTLKYIATVINWNHLRTGMQADYLSLTSHAIFVNLSLILFKMSLPFLDSSYKKFDRIDKFFFDKQSYFDLQDQTRINATEKEYEEYAKDHASTEKTNFISDCFFLGLGCLHFGIGGLILDRERVSKEVKQLEQQVERLKELTEKSKASGNTLSFAERTYAIRLPQFELMLTNAKASKTVMNAFFLDREIQLQIFDFVVGASVFMVRSVDPNSSYPFRQITLPLIPDEVNIENIDNAEELRKKSPTPFRYYPEFVIECLVNYASHIIQYANHPLFNNPRLKHFVEFVIVMLRCPEILGNPHLKGNFVELLFFGSLPMQNGHPGIMFDVFITDPLIIDNLLYALLDFYVVVEKTGASSQFYDKFNSRFHMAVILESLWNHEVYRSQFKKQSAQNKDFFVRFVARMLNDTTFLLDESLRDLIEIHELESEIENRKNGAEPVMEGTDEELANHLASIERQAKSYINLGNKTVNLFKIFTLETPKAFVTPEIVDRLAGMLNYNLNALVGKKYTQLKVKDPLKFNFQPRQLLLNICKIFVNLSREREFLNAVSRDSRSFKHELFIKARGFLQRYSLASGDFIDDFVRFGDKAQAQKLEDEEKELELGDIPDELLDPLMYELMVDPVILPSSKVTVDRSTIKAHLLNDPTDPFNRMPLKLDEVKPDLEMKQKIETFKAERRAEKEKSKTEDGDITMTSPP